ncbi:MAG: peptidylprolyl isomerase [Candidatus Aminicenantia bacterium]
MVNKKNYFLIILLILSINCSKPEPQKKIEDKVIFEIEGKFYKESDFKTYLNLMKYESIDQKPAILSRILDRFFETAVVSEFARLKGFQLPEEKLLKLDRKKDEREKIIKELNIMYEAFLTDVIKNRLSITKEEVEEYYKTHEEEFKREETVRVYQILVSSESEALEILRILKQSPPQEFEKIARERSISPEGVRGGDMGYFQRGELPLEIENVVFSLKVGELSPVVKSSFGYHIFKVVEKKGARLLPLKDVEKNIAEDISYGKKDMIEKELIEEAKNGVKWRIYYENLSFSYIKGETND